MRPTSHSTDRGPSFSVSGNRLTITKTNLGFLIVYAYGTGGGVRPLGGPNWTWSEHDEDAYDVVGIAEGEAKWNPAELKLMLQALLTDRFNLVVHREIRDIPVFVLKVAKSAARLGEANPDDGQPDSGYRKVRGSRRPWCCLNWA